jgi:hypothetical protein
MGNKWILRQKPGGHLRVFVFNGACLRSSKRHRKNDPASRLVNRLLAVLILANIAAVILESVGTLNEDEGSQLSIRSARSKHGWARLTFYPGLAKVGGEMSLHALAYNLKQVMKIMGTRHLVAALRA